MTAFKTWRGLMPPPILTCVTKRLPSHPTLQILHEANPSYPERAVKYDALIAALEHGGPGADVALLGLQELEGSELSAQAVLSSMSAKPATANEVRHWFCLCGVKAPAILLLKVSTEPNGCNHASNLPFTPCFLSGLGPRPAAEEG